MTTGVKIGIGLAVAVLVGAGIYYGFFHKAEELVADKKDPVPPGGSGIPESKGPKKLTKLEEALLAAKCNSKFPPPRFNKDKKDAYDKCMHSAAGTWG